MQVQGTFAPGGAQSDPVVEADEPAVPAVEAPRPPEQPAEFVPARATSPAAARALAELYCSTNRFSILKFEKRFSVEPYGLVLMKDHPLSPGARTLLAAIRAALPRPVVPDLERSGTAP